MAAYHRVYDSRHLRLTAKNRDQLRNPTLGNRLWATSTLFTEGWALNVTTATLDRCSHGETLPVPRPSPWKSDRGRTFPPRTSSRSLTGTACRQCGRTAADVRASPTDPPADNLLRDDKRRTVRRILVRGVSAPCRLRRRKLWKSDYEMVHSGVYLNKYVVSIAPFSTPACPDCSQSIT